MNLHEQIPIIPDVAECCTGTSENECFLDPLTARDANIVASHHDRTQEEMPWNIPADPNAI